ncbi:LEA type 2 family protein [Novispirillum sp. DQ9]|uniref:LEA type 2 family protein n=1 Tax=Novispirillum sp. DQ9 TaxID=3398612 RepID=UPI003C7D460F
MNGQRHSRTSRGRNICFVACAATIGAATVAACAAAPESAGSIPEVRLANLRPSLGGPLAPSFLADLRLTNPSARRVSIDGVTFNLSLGGLLMATGVRNQPLSIAPRADEALTVEARPTTRGVVAHLFALGGGDGVPYAIRGEVYRQGRTDSTESYASAGTLDLYAGGLQGLEPHYRVRGF